MEYSAGIASPERFRLWSAITAVAGALERRVFTITTGKAAYANIITLLVGPPGSGKTESIDITQEIWVEAGTFFVAPNNVTKAALIDALYEAKRDILVDETTLIDFHSLLVAAPEFGVLVPAHDLEFLSVINYLWDNPKFYREKRRGLKDATNPTGEIDISKPQITILAGTQPGYLSSLLPEEAWTMGTMSRSIMVYSGAVPDVPLFDVELRDASKLKALILEMRRIAQLIGPMTWTPEAMRIAEEWRQGKLKPTPTHSRLQHYNSRRMFTAIKLAMVASVSRSNDMVIRAEDFERGRDWLLSAEPHMTDVFKDMANKSDRAILEETYYYCWSTFIKEHKKDLHEARIAAFLSVRIPADKIDRIIKAMVQMGMLRDIGAGFYQPQPMTVAAGVE